jgi:hypothetical protein
VEVVFLILGLILLAIGLSELAHALIALVRPGRRRDQIWWRGTLLEQALAYGIPDSLEKSPGRREMIIEAGVGLLFVVAGMIGILGAM